MNKAKKKPVSKDCYTSSTRSLDIAHTDILGSIDQIAGNGHRYAIGFVDNCSRYLNFYFRTTRDAVTEKLERFVAYGGVPQILVSDGAGEYISQEYMRVCRKQKIRIKTSAPHTPQENEKIERVCVTITQMARCIVLDATLLKTYWLHALDMATKKKLVLTFCYRQNTLQVKYGKKSKLNFLKSFGCVAYNFVKKQFRKKLDKNSEENFLGDIRQQKQACLIGIENKGKLKMKKYRNVSLVSLISILRKK